MALKKNKHFSSIASRIHVQNLSKTIDDLTTLLFAEDEKRVVVFTNGISKYRFKRLMALSLLNLENFDFMREHGSIPRIERIAGEDNIDMLVEDLTCRGLTLVSDSQWQTHPMSLMLYKEVLAADYVFEVNRPRQTCISAVFEQIAAGATPEEILETIDIFSELIEEEDDLPYCNEYEHAGEVMRYLLSRSMAGLRQQPRVKKLIRQLFGLWDIPL